MFKLQDHVTYWWPVTVQMPENGAFVPHKFMVQFASLTPTEGEKLIEETKGEHDPLLRRVIKGWRDVTGADEAALPFNEANLGQMLGQNWARLGLYTAWNESHLPEQRRAGN